RTAVRSLVPARARRLRLVTLTARSTRGSLALVQAEQPRASRVARRLLSKASRTSAGSTSRILGSWTRRQGGRCCDEGDVVGERRAWIRVRDWFRVRIRIRVGESAGTALWMCSIWWVPHPRGESRPL